MGECFLGAGAAVYEEKIAELEAKIRRLHSELDYAYLAIDFGFRRKVFDFSVLAERARKWAEEQDV
jgi:hypothetical protein